MGALTLAVGLAGCAGATPAPVAAGAFTEGDAALFDDQVSFLERPSELSADMREQWAHEVGVRVRRAQVVAVVRVRTMQDSTTVAGARHLRLTAIVEEPLSGAPDATLELGVDSGTRAFDVLERSEDRMLGERFVAFVRYAVEPETGETVAHFHLCVWSKALVDRVQEVVRRGTKQRVIVYEHAR